MFKNRWIPWILFLFLVKYLYDRKKILNLTHYLLLSDDPEIVQLRTEFTDQAIASNMPIEVMASKVATKILRRQGIILFGWII